MIPIDNNLPYSVLKDGDDLQIIHECEGKTLISFTDPNTNKVVLSWVESEWVQENDAPKKPLDNESKRVQIRLIYSSERGLIEDSKREEASTWDTSKHLLYRWLVVLSQLALVLLALFML